MPFESEAGLSSSAATPKRDKDESNSEWAKMSIGESREDENVIELFVLLKLLDRDDLNELLEP